MNDRKGQPDLQQGQLGVLNPGREMVYIQEGCITKVPNATNNATNNASIVELNGFAYTLVPPSDYNSAIQSCQAKGFNLATFSTEQEYTDIRGAVVQLKGTFTAKYVFCRFPTEKTGTALYLKIVREPFNGLYCDTNQKHFEKISVKMLSSFSSI